MVVYRAVKCGTNIDFENVRPETKLSAKKKSVEREKIVRNVHLETGLSAE